jgi:LacI family transcriptional regulator
MSVTLREIAEETGLSVPTVGNVLGRAAARYSAETRRKVAEAARRLGYKPNSSARAMRYGRFGCAALVLNRSRQTTHSYLPAGLLDGLDDELARHDMHLTVSRLSDEELASEDFVPKVLREHTADGIIVNYTHEIPTAMLELIRGHHAPAVWVNAKLSCDCVYADDRRAAREITEGLIELGHRRIALVHLISRLGWTGSFADQRPRMHYSVTDRSAGFTAAMRRAGLAPHVLAQDRFIPEADQIEACRALLSGEDRPTALLAYSENELQTVMCVARMLGLEVPRDVSVVVFAPVPTWVAGHLTAIAAVPTEEIGRRAVRMLLKRMQAPDLSAPGDPVTYGLEPGATIGPAPG